MIDDFFLVWILDSDCMGIASHVIVVKAERCPQKTSSKQRDCIL